MTAQCRISIAARIPQEACTSVARVFPRASTSRR